MLWKRPVPKSVNAFVIFLVCSLTGLGCLSASTSHRENDGKIPENPVQNRRMLAKILKKTADYCKRLDEISIYYYCRERIKETIYPIPRRYWGFIKTGVGIHGEFDRFINKDFIANELLYDYQMVRRGKKGVREQRVLLEENGQEKNTPNAGLKTLAFDYHTIVYGPLVFDAEEQRYYDFEMIGEEEWQGRRVVAVQVLPRSGTGKQLTWGEFWVDKSDYSIVKIKVSQKSMGNYDHIEKKALVMNAEPRISIILDYQVEKNGIRFPSDVLIEEAYVSSNDEKIVLSRIEVDYFDYRFFTVGVKVKEKHAEALK